MRLFISNPTTSEYVFNYRCPEDSLLKLLTIKPGHGAVIAKNYEQNHIDSLIKQIENAGGRDAAEAYGNMGSFQGLIYRVDGIISSDEISLAHEGIDETMGQRSVDELTKAAISIAHDGIVNKNADEVEVSVVEEFAPNVKATKDAVNFKIGVSKDGTAPLPKVN